jgi:tetratricopeptide (TPR) repeat protein
MTTTIQQATALIRDGFDAQNRGESSNAEAQYARALRLVPEHPTALQLLGLLRKRQGDLTGAEDLMRRSLRALPAQPHVWNNLGNLLEDTQRVAEALNCFEQAVALDANYADGHYNRARLLLARL